MGTVEGRKNGEAAGLGVGSSVWGGGPAAQEEHDFSQAPKAQEDRFVKSRCSDAKRTSDNIRA